MSSLYHKKLSAVKAACTSREAFIRAIETKADCDDNGAERNSWKNEDLAISPPKDRTWSWYSYAAFWCTTVSTREL